MLVREVAGLTARGATMVANMRPEDLRFDDDVFSVPTGREPIDVSWMGTAGFRIEHAGYTVLIDPYLTRAPLWSCLRGPLASDVALVTGQLPRADAIVAGHTHFDHVLDVPAIARHTGARVFGSRSCAALCRAAGIAESHVVDVECAHRHSEPFQVEIGPFTLRFVPSVHSAFAFGRVPFIGDISDCDQLPMRTEAYRCGAVFGVDIRVAGRRIYHLGSADLLEANVSAEVDLLLMCVAGWTTTKRFAPRVMSALRPDAVWLSHWDDFFSPLARGPRMLPAMQLERLVEALGAEDRSVHVGTTPFFVPLRL